VNPCRKQWEREESRHVPWPITFGRVERRVGTSGWD